MASADETLDSGARDDSTQPLPKSGIPLPNKATALYAHSPRQDSCKNAPILPRAVFEDEGRSPDVRIPDLFSSIMSSQPIMNPLYSRIKQRSEAWMKGVLSGQTESARRITKADFCYLASIWAPTSDEENLFMLVKWIHWGFLFDDQFDEGRFSTDVNAAKREINEMNDILDDPQLSSPADVGDPIRSIFIDTWCKLRQRSTPSFQDHWKAMHRHYFEGLVAQVEAQVEGSALTQNVHEYMEIRRGTVGVLPAIAMTEFAIGIDLPDHVLSHPAIRECMVACADHALLTNDVLSYKKDVELGVEHNLIALLMKQNHTPQNAMDKIDVMLAECYHRWYSALARVPVLGEATDRIITKVTESCRAVALGNLHWSFKTARYLGCDGVNLRQTRMLRMPLKNGLA